MWINFLTDWKRSKGKHILYTGLSKKMDGIWNRYNLKSTGRIYTFGVLKYSEKFKVFDLLEYICKLIIVKLNLI